jgi:AbrB family looped-hinge helix DNA binding protein
MASWLRPLDAIPGIPYSYLLVRNLRERKMAAATVTSKGQITIPKEVREALGLETGHRVSFQVRKDGVVEMSSENLDVMSLCGVLKPSVRGVTVEDMEKAIRKGATGK